MQTNDFILSNQPKPSSEYCAHVRHTAQIQDQRLQPLYELWEARRGDRTTPARSDFTVFDFKPWLGHIVILDNLHSRTAIRFRLFGSKLTDIFGADLTRKTLLEAAVLIGDRPLIEYEEVARSGRPIYVSRFSPTLHEHIQVDKLMLPLASDGRVDQILAALYPSPSS